MEEQQREDITSSAQVMDTATALRMCACIYLMSFKLLNFSLIVYSMHAVFMASY